MEVVQFKTGPISANTYIVFNPQKNQGFVIDPGGNYKRIVKEAQDRGIELVAQLFTHGHFDHCGAGARLQKDGIKAYIHRLDADKLTGTGNLSYLLGLEFENFAADVLLEDGDILDLAGISVKVLHTPGHSRGAVCYVAEDCIFSGDTLFDMAVGRTDFPDGNAKDLINSIQNKLFTLTDDYRLLPGHDAESTLSYQRAYNPYAQPPL